MSDYFNDSSKQVLLREALSVAVPFWIMEIKAAGGPDLSKTHDLSHLIAEHGDAILYRVPGKTAAAFNALAEGVALLSFAPGGVSVFGLHFESRMDNT
jgi:hypothetical protein